MGRRLLEVSIFWRGELLAVRQLSVGQKLDALNLPESADVVVQTRECEVVRRRSSIDLPLGAIAVVAALLHTGVVASFVFAPEHVASGVATKPTSYIVTTERADFEPTTVIPMRRDTPGCASVADFLATNPNVHL
jgi:hypothetical protein